MAHSITCQLKLPRWHQCSRIHAQHATQPICLSCFTLSRELPLSFTLSIHLGLTLERQTGAGRVASETRFHGNTVLRNCRGRPLTQRNEFSHYIRNTAVRRATRSKPGWSLMLKGEWHPLEIENHLRATLHRKLPDHLIISGMERPHTNMNICRFCFPYHFTVKGLRVLTDFLKPSASLQEYSRIVADWVTSTSLDAIIEPASFYSKCHHLCCFRLSLRTLLYFRFFLSLLFKWKCSTNGTHYTV